MENSIDNNPKYPKKCFKINKRSIDFYRNTIRNYFLNAYKNLTIETSTRDRSIRDKVDEIHKLFDMDSGKQTENVTCIHFYHYLQFNDSSLEFKAPSHRRRRRRTAAQSFSQLNSDMGYIIPKRTSSPKRI